MLTTRRLSLTLLLVAPLMAVPEVEDSSSNEDAGPPSHVSAVSGEHLPLGNRNKHKLSPEEVEFLATFPPEIVTSGNMDELTTSYTTASQTFKEELTSTQVQESQTLSAKESPSHEDKYVGIPEGVPLNVYGWLRKRREVDSPDDMETAEQVLFRPLFRHRQILEDRLKRQRASEALRRQSQATEVSSSPQLKPDSGQERYDEISPYQPVYQRNYLAHKSHSIAAVRTYPVAY